MKATTYIANVRSMTPDGKWESEWIQSDRRFKSKEEFAESLKEEGYEVGTIAVLEDIKTW